MSSLKIETDTNVPRKSSRVLITEQEDLKKKKKKKKLLINQMKGAPELLE